MASTLRLMPSEISVPVKRGSHDFFLALRWMMGYNIRKVGD